MEHEEPIDDQEDFPFAKLLSSLPRYDGKEAWQLHEASLVQWRVLNMANRAGHDWQKTALLYSLKGGAAERASTIGRGTEAFAAIAGWNGMMIALRNIFAPQADSEISRVAFRAQRQNPKEDIVSYLTAKISLWRCAYPLPAQRQYDQLLDACIDGMFNKVIKRLVRRHNPRNQADLITVATNAVAAERYAYSGGYSECTSLDGLTTIIETTQGKQFDLANNKSEPMEVDAMREAREARKCYNCNIRGHLAKDCRKPKKKEKNQSQDFKKKIKCFNCDQQGHYARECRKPKKKKPDLKVIEEVDETDGEDGED